MATNTQPNPPVPAGFPRSGTALPGRVAVAVLGGSGGAFGTLPSCPAM
ncbi:MAG: hypothetical protein QOC62_2361 [Mycobacterium sp.]|jgi:hypothetical protein|nr:hypothetical protein [Mycobacterium sp.]